MGLDMYLFKKTRKEGHDVYWRKANAIHHWFVENCQNGVDECAPASVSVEELHELLSVCKQVNENHDLAQSLLPTRSGFFYGSTDYDVWYFEDLEFTITELEKLLAEPGTNETTYVYQSSW